MIDVVVSHVALDRSSALVVTGDVDPEFARMLHESTGVLVVVLRPGMTIAALDDEQLAAAGLVRITEGLKSVVQSSDREFMWTDHHRPDHECSDFDEEADAVRRVLG